MKDNEFVIFSEMMDAKSLFLTANADTVYFWGNVDLSDGPLVVQTPPGALGIFDDFWFRWLGDFGLPGPDRGEGGRYLLIPPGYDGPLPEDGFHIRRSRTNLVTVLGRCFLVDNDPVPAIGIVKGEEFAPDARLREILESAVSFGNAASRTLGTGAHPRERYRYYDSSSAWWNMLFDGGYEFQTPQRYPRAGEVEEIA